jgi:[ribosomal protein S18]-alanine N-acetyltransferase
VSSEGRASLPLELRRLERGQADLVAAIHVSAFNESAEHALERAAASLREELTRPWAQVWVAWSALEPVGVAVLWIVADEVHVLDVATRPDVRRQGVGRALVRKIIAIAGAHEAKSLYLEVRRSNEPAILLYRSLGFIEAGVRRRYYPDDEDALDMSLALSPVDSITG